METASTAPPDVRAIVRDLYHGCNGYLLSSSDKSRVLRAGSAPTYGELMPMATQRLLDYLSPTRHDVLYDLGSGIGKWVLHAALSTNVKRAVGVELAHGRHVVALETRELAIRQGYERASLAEFVHDDLLRVDFSDATVIYSCSTSFPIAVMEGVVKRLRYHQPGTRLVSLQPVMPVPWFEEIDLLLLDTTWKRRCRVHVYRLL